MTEAITTQIANIAGLTIQDLTTLNNQTRPYKSLITSTTANQKTQNQKNQNQNKIILLATCVIEDTTLFSNGLFQNVFNLYDVFESMNYVPIILYEKKPDQSKIQTIIKNYRYVLPETVIKSEIPIYCVIEIGMTCQEEFRQYFRDFGARFIKLHLGNVLNIDIEISTRMPEVHFIHHLTGNYDELFTSPHYNQNREYSAIMNGVLPEKSKIAPYVWSDTIFNLYESSKNLNLTLKWDEQKDWRKRDIVICEPNLGFQKSFYVPLLLASDYLKRNPEWSGTIKMYNAHNINKTTNFSLNTIPFINIPKERLQLFLRYPIIEIMNDNSGAVFIGHQVNNEYNYMTMELMSRNYPLLHNAEGWKSYGYYYNTSQWNTALTTLDTILKRHSSNKQSYKSHYETLKWTHSPYNPVVQEQWDRIVYNQFQE